MITKLATIVMVLALSTAACGPRPLTAEEATSAHQAVSGLAEAAEGALGLESYAHDAIDAAAGITRTAGITVTGPISGTTWCSDLAASAAEYGGTAKPRVEQDNLIDIEGPASLHPDQKASELTTVLKDLGKVVEYVPWFGILVADGEHIMIQAMSGTNIFVYDSYTRLEDLANRWNNECRR